MLPFCKTSTNTAQPVSVNLCMCPTYYDGYLNTFILLCFVLQTIVPWDPHLETDFLSKSLGFTVKKAVDNLDDPRMAREWQLYEEMLRASKDSLEKRGEDEEARLETVVGKERAKTFRNCKAFHDFFENVCKQAEVAKRFIYLQMIYAVSNNIHETAGTFSQLDGNVQYV